MTNRELYRQYLQQLQHLYAASEASVITDLVFEKTAGLKRADIVRNPEELVPDEICIDLDTNLTALLKHTPVQYVLGEAWFYKMKLKVNEATLIPRPETEELVQLVIDNFKSAKSHQQDVVISTGEKSNLINDDNKVSMLDIGTGSGCIAIAVKKNLPEITMLAIDVSEGALSIAKENASFQQVTVEFKQLNFLDESSWETLPVFDIIISNPPYIPINEKDKLDSNVTAFEPHTALFVPDNNPFLFYEKIAAFGKKHLTGNGKIYVEIHEDFAKETGQFFEENYTVEVRKDIFGKERMLIISPTLRNG